MCCCLFGLIDYKYNLTTKQKNRILFALAVAAEARGTDATGIAYNSDGKLRIYKRPWPAHYMRFRVSADAAAIMGHTRMTTQGLARFNPNNHPFPGHVKEGPFALAHNGVLWNDGYLRKAMDLPKTKIETDSYVGVQLIEKRKALDFDSLRFMAEHVEGSFTFSALDHRDNLYLVKGDNPLCLYHYPKMGLYLYASTEEILKAALHRIRPVWERPENIPIVCGDILRIDSAGNITRDAFDADNLLWGDYISPWRHYVHKDCCAVPKVSPELDYMDELKAVAMTFGYTPENIDQLAAQGWSAEEIENLLYESEVW